MTANPKLLVNLTPDIRLTSDGERNYTLLERVTVDPAKGPNWSARLAADPTLDPSPREEWRQVDAYWPLNDRGLTGAIMYAINRQSVADGAQASAEGPLELAEFAAIISGHSERISDAVSYVMKV
jgi:hypothetical protein